MAMTLAISPVSAIASRKKSGSRKRSEPNTMVASLGAHRITARRDLVADAPDGHDRRRVAELAAELPNVHVDGARVARERVPPDALEQLVARQHEALVVEQLPEQIELLGSELDLLLADPDLPAAGVDDEVTVGKHVRLAVAPLGGRSAKDRLHARDELPRVERLRHVVVGANLEADDLVDVLVARSQHEDRHVPALPHPAAELDPVDVGKHEVEDDELRRARREVLHRLGAGGGGLDRVASVLQVERDERRDRRLVLHDEDRLGLGRRHGVSVLGTLYVDPLAVVRERLERRTVDGVLAVVRLRRLTLDPRAAATHRRDPDARAPDANVPLVEQTESHRLVSRGEDADRHATRA